MSFGGKQSGGQASLDNRDSEFSNKKNSFEAIRSSSNSINQESTIAATKYDTYELESQTQATRQDLLAEELSHDFSTIL